MMKATKFRTLILALLILTLGFSYAVSQTSYTRSNTTAYASTTTDTIGTYLIGDFDFAYFSVYYDLEANTTITQTITLLDVDYKPISAAITISSAITADAHGQALLRNRDTTQAIQPRFYIKRITTVTGDSVTCYSRISACGK